MKITDVSTERAAAKDAIVIYDGNIWMPKWMQKMPGDIISRRP